ncbi:MAG: hypothetical protein JW797_16430 [Bradymonadales bacterium]|nr:hypothetical protein [Bradymonadales bacterium]
MLAFTTTATPLAAQQVVSNNEPPTPFSGAYTGLGILLGGTVLSNQEVDSPWGLSFGPKFRVSMVLSLFDLQLTYLHSHVEPTIQEHKVKFVSDGLSLSLGLHPLFFFTLLGTDLGPTLAQLSLQAGLSLEFNRFEWDQRSSSDLGVVGAHLGLAWDYPIDDVQDGRSFWLGVQYRYNITSTDLPLLENPDPAWTQHFLFLRLTYLVNGYPL